MAMKFALAAGCAVLAAGLAAGAWSMQARSREVAFVANAEGATVAIVDIAERRILGSIDINPEKTRVDRPGTPNYAQDTDVSADGRTLFVSRGYLGDVAAFDIASGRMLWKRPLNTGRADHMTLTPDGRSLFVSAIFDNKVYRLTAATGAISGEFDSGVYPHDNKVTKDGRLVFNSSLGVLGGLSNSPPTAKQPAIPVQLTVAEAGSLKVLDRIPVEKAFRPWQFAPGEKTIYAQLSNVHGVIAYDVAAKAVVRRLELPVKPGATAADWDFEAPHHGLSLTEDGSILCIAGRASDYAALVSAPDLKLIATVPVGDAPGWSEVDEAGRVCLTANSRNDTLSFISIRERAEVLRMPVGDGPKHITIARLPQAVLAAMPGP